MRAEGAEVAKGASLVLSADARRGKSTLDSFDLVVARRDDSGTDTPLVKATAALDPGSGVVSGTWTLAADSQRLSMLLSTESTPDFEIDGGGKYTFNPATSVSTASGRLNGSAGNLERISSGLAGVGRLAFQADFETTGGAGKLSVRSANARVSTPDGRILLALATVQPVDIDYDSLHARVAGTTSPAATLEIGDLPLAWADPFVEGGRFSGTIDGGSFALSMNDDRLSAETTRQLVARNVSVTLAGRPLVQKVDITWDGSVGLNGKNIEADARKLLVSQGSSQLLSIKTTVSTNPADVRGAAKGTIAADLGALMAQPFASDMQALTAGRLSADFNVDYSDAISADAKLSATGLVAAANGQPLGDLAVSLTAKGTPGKSARFSLPVSIVNSGRRSDVTLSGDLAQRPDGLTFTGRLDGGTIYIGDLQLLAGLLPSNETTSQEAGRPAGPARGRDKNPFWS